MQFDWLSYNSLGSYSLCFEGADTGWEVRIYEGVKNEQP